MLNTLLERRNSGSKSGQRMPSIRRRNRGFTLVELMIAMALLGALTSIIYGLFHTTSQTLMEVESLAETTDNARFALEHIRNDLQAAGAQSSPDSEVDPWVAKTNTTITGIVPYKDWQGSTPHPPESSSSSMTVANPHSQFDGMVLVGAYDIPQSILLREVIPSSASTAVISEHVRGMPRLLNSDPFNVDHQVSENYESLLSTVKPEEAMKYRMLRITDRQGFLQFTPISSALVVTKEEQKTIQLNLGDLQTATGNSLIGIDEVNEDDVEYEAALLDGFWYHVVEDPYDPSNFQLVRDRINLNDINFKEIADYKPQAATDEAGRVVERVVIANRVVDFRLWFDCGDTNGQVTAIPWHTRWTSPATNNSDNINTCLKDKIGLARVAHIRLSLRTTNESSNNPHLSVVPSWPGFEDADTRMQTYDIEPSIPGAARVITVQATVELSNFAMRNLR